MPLLKSIEIENFRCFRKIGPILLSHATYLVGINNSGKTSLLSAIRCFFESNTYESEYLNKTELARRGKGANKTIITIEIDLEAIEGKTLRQKLNSKYGKSLKISKTFTTKEISRIIDVEYTINNQETATFDTLDKDIQTVLSAVTISYIHPQEGDELLRKAQMKFKTRLFNNWGRHASIAEKLNQLQEKWDELRITASNYLSASLTENLKSIWPTSSLKVDLPGRIEDIVAISEIKFRSSPSFPEITLTSQGTGAQSTILYQTHYLLDSDKSLHRGPYFPIWLLEEPESFLHADIAVKLGKLLNSDEWLSNIQMIISTHSPIILASSKQNEDKTRWVVFDQHMIKSNRIVSELRYDSIKEVSDLMGDPNFDAYFFGSIKAIAIFIEDKRQLTVDKFREAGISIVQGLQGVSEVSKYISVFLTLGEIVRHKAVFMIDNDNGKKEFKTYLTENNKIKERDGFKLYRIAKNVFILLLPENFACEDLFEGFNGVLNSCCEAIFCDDFKLKEQAPVELSRTASELRRKDRPRNMQEARRLIKNTQDVKDLFWKKVAESPDDSSYQISKRYIEVIKNFVE